MIKGIRLTTTCSAHGCGSDRIRCLGSRSRVRIADFRRGQVRLGWSDYQGLFDPRRWRTTSVYTKPIVVLIAPTQSSSQEIIPTRVRDTRRGLLVGAPTAGTNGNATSIALPGGGSFRFTGMRLLNPDGSRFNGTGAQPDIRVDRTFEGVRARRDEVLDAGVEALRSLIATQWTLRCRHNRRTRRVRRSSRSTAIEIGAGWTAIAFLD